MKNKEQKRKEAQEREEIYNKLTVLEKLNKLNDKFGPNNGADKQRNKLKKLLKKEK